MTTELMFWTALAIFAVLWVLAAIFDGADSLAVCNAIRSLAAGRSTAPAPIDPIDADEANYGPCALGEEHDQ